MSSPTSLGDQPLPHRNPPRNCHPPARYCTYAPHILLSFHHLSLLLTLYRNLSHVDGDIESAFFLFLSLSLYSLLFYLVVLCVFSIVFYFSPTLTM